MIVSIEYAKALFELNSSLKEKEETKDNLNSLKLIFDDEISKYFLYPGISVDKKKEIIDQSVNVKLIRDFLYVLLDNDRFDILNEIIDDYNKLLLDYKNSLVVYVVSSYELDKDYINKLYDICKKKFNKEIVIENVIDKSIKAGIKIRYESKEIDLTIDSKFDRVKNSIKE